MLQLDLDKAVKAVLNKKAKRVAVQAPEGLKARLARIVKEIEGKTEVSVFAFVEPCFGACDVADERAKALGAELLLHFGHGQFVGKHAVETVYLPLEYRVDKGKLRVLAGRLAAELRKGKVKKVALCSTAQFLGHLPGLKRELGKKGIGTVIGKGKNVERGQVLGCNYGVVKAVEKGVGAIVFVGDGLFHPLGISFFSSKRVFAADPLEGEVRQVGKERDLFLKKRVAMIEKGKRAKRVAIWVSTKRGQQRMGLARELEEKFEKKGKEALVVVSDFLNPDYLLGVDVGAIVNTACPRIALDDSSSYKRPVLNPGEALIALGDKKIENYGFEELG